MKFSKVELSGNGRDVYLTHAGPGPCEGDVLVLNIGITLELEDERDKANARADENHAALVSLKEEYSEIFGRIWQALRGEPTPESAEQFPLVPAVRAMKAELDAAMEQVSGLKSEFYRGAFRYRDTLRFMRQTIHQAGHDGPMEDCPRNTCQAATVALTELEPKT